jgi:glycyl-tRNA synthetase beta chain
LEQRGIPIRTVRAVLHAGIEHLSPLTARRIADALEEMSGSDALIGVATLLKRAKNITKGIESAVLSADVRDRMKEPAEIALLAALDARTPPIQAARERTDYREVFSQIAQLQPAVAKFFDDVLVMSPDESLRAARLALVSNLRNVILAFADLSEMVTES